LSLHHAGPMLVLADAGAYLDLEAALAASDVVDAEVQLSFDPMHPAQAGVRAQFGSVRGDVVIEGRRVVVDTGGFAKAGGFRAAGAQDQTMIAVAFGSDRAVLTRVRGDEGFGLSFTPELVQPLDGTFIAVATDGDAYTPVGFECGCAGTETALRGQPLS